MKESLAARKSRTKVIIKILKRYYPGATCALHHSNPLELLVATILSAQCTDQRVNQVTKDLFQKYRTAEDYANAKPAELENTIRSLGFFRAKAKSLKGMGEKLRDLFGGEIPRDLKSLTQLPGVGRKTANVVLGTAFQITSGVVVDTHVKRLAYRLGLTDKKAPEQVEKDLQEEVPRADWIFISHGLILHGRQVCKARRPLCEKCPLEGVCPQRGVKRSR